MKRLSKLICLIMVITCCGKAFGQTNNETEPSIVMEYKDYKFFNDEPDYKLFEDNVILQGYSYNKTADLLYVLDNKQCVFEYDLQNALSGGIKRTRAFNLPFNVETTSNTMEISPNGKLLAFVDKGGEYLHIINVSSGLECASCEIGEKYHNENNNGHPFNFISDNEILVSGSERALLYNIEKKEQKTLTFDEKYRGMSVRTVTSIGTITGYPEQKDSFGVATFFISNGKIEKIIENLSVYDYYPFSPFYTHVYYKKYDQQEFYDRITGERLNFSIDYLNSDMDKYNLRWDNRKKSQTLRRFLLPNKNHSDNDIKLQSSYKKYSLWFPEFVFANWLSNNQIMFVRREGKIQFFNHTLTDNEIAKQALRIAIEKNDVDAINQFIEDFPESRYVSIAKQKKAEFEQIQLPLSATNRAKVYRTLPLVGAVEGEFYVGKYTGGTTPSKYCDYVGDREMTLEWSFDPESGRIGFSIPHFKGLNYNNLIKEVSIVLGNGQQASWGRQGFPSFYLPDYHDETFVVSWINTSEQTGTPDRRGYYTIYKEHNHQINYTLPINVKEATAYYFFNQAKKASLKNAITYVKDCKNDDYRREVENEIVSGKTGSIPDIVYCNDNYPKLSDRLEDKMFGLIGSMADCESYLKYYLPSKRGSAIDDKVYQYVDPSNEVGDCETYLKYFPNGNHKAAVTAQKNELVSYNAARRGGKTECTAYLTKYPHGRFTSEIQTKKDNIVKEEKRQAQIKTNSNKGLWKLGNKLCNCTSEGVIMVTLDQWNENHSSFKGIVSASPGGLFNGDLLQKGNQLWFDTKGWHLCLEDEIDYALKNDKSLEAERLQKAKSMMFKRGTIVSRTYQSTWYSSSYRVKGKVDDWNEDYTRMKVQIIDTDGLGSINGESVYEGKYIWVSPIGWE